MAQTLDEKTYYVKIDKLVKSHSSVFVIPANAGIQGNQALLDSRFRGSDGLGDFLQLYQYCTASINYQKPIDHRENG